jgi:hypothetical protein
MEFRSFVRRRICYSTRLASINGPCGIWNAKSTSRRDNQVHRHNDLRMEDHEVDLLYIEVLTDNQEFCGQSAIPLSLLRRGSLFNVKHAHELLICSVFSRYPIDTIVR